jgi:DNA ligase-4
MSDPKSRSGEQDKKNLMTLSVFSLTDALRQHLTPVSVFTRMEALVHRSLPASRNSSSYMEEQLPVSFLNLVTQLFRSVLVAYDLKLVIDKGIHDVLKPDWVKDSIALGHPMPFRKKYGPR